MNPPLETPELYPFWAEDAAGDVRLGLSESFLETLGGEPVGIELAPPGSRIRKGDTLGFLHTPERAFDLRAPRALEIIEVNPAAESDPRLVKLAPYTRGWLMLVRYI
ncbi:glycine cleavage system protein H [bacterium]|jgi:glycine cleavage system H lipoate-binding protein|nr:glycine cleavage system protein H [bacterium]